MQDARVPSPVETSVLVTSGLDPLEGETTFMSPEAKVQRTTELLGDGALVVEVASPSSAHRGRLAELIDEVIERELARLAGFSYTVEHTDPQSSDEDWDARLADQIGRAAAAGATGLVLALGALGWLARPALTPADSATLERLALQTRVAPFVMLLDDGDGRALAYPQPIPLDALLDVRAAHDRTANDTVMSAIAPPLANVPLNDERSAQRGGRRSPQGVSGGEGPRANDEARRHSSYEQALKRLHVTRQETSIEIELTTPSVRQPEEAAATEEEPEVAPMSAPVGRSDAISTPRAAPSRIIPPDVLADSMRVVQTAVEAVVPVGDGEAPEPAKFDSEAPTEPELEVAPTPAPEPPPEPKPRTTARDRKRATMGIPVSGPNDYWRTWAIALSSARGPQTLATFERLFAESYVPLANAIADGLDDARALRAYDEFRRAFEHTYTEAFATFGVTNRRPKLVMDAYDLASKQSRLHNARSAHVLVVDSMRFDLGALVRDHLARAAAGIASLTAETVLWSALPTTTLRQLETFARGMDALRAPSPIEATESLRGRSAEVVRRLRVGSRELYKLDIIPAMLEGCPRETAGLIATHEQIAEAVATSLFHHLRTLAPRTLLFIVGDHGFTIDRRGEILHGGASPEEVLVPAQAWLIGDLH